jgi:hypothetical protein
MKNNIFFIIFISSFAVLKPARVEHAFPSDYVTEILAQALTHEQLNQIGTDNTTNVKQSFTYNNQPDAIIQMSCSIERNGDRVIVRSTIHDTLHKKVTSSEELSDLQATFTKFQQRSLSPDADTHSRCKYATVSASLNNEPSFDRTVHTSCTTEMSVAEFIEFIKLYKTH